MKQIGTIMIIDDDDVNNFICRRIIEKSGLTDNVLTFTGARDGLDHLQSLLESGQEVPDLVLLDLNMPVMSGWEFLDEYRELAGRIEKRVILIVFSSSVYQEDIDRAKSYPHVADYRSKPINLQVLQEINSAYFS